VDFDTNAGTGPLPIVFEGYTTATGDGGSFTITGSGARASCLVFNGVADHITFKNIILTSPTTQCVLGTTVSAGILGIKFINFQMLKGSSTPSRAIYGGGYIRFSRMLLKKGIISGGFSGNGVQDVADLLTIVDTKIIDCGGHGISINGYGAGLRLIRSIVAGNTNDGINIGSSGGDAAGIVIVGNTIEGNGGDGIDINGANHKDVIIQGNIIANHSGVGDTGLKVGTISGSTTIWCDNNFYYNNTTHRSGNNTTGDNDVTLSGDPFTASASDNWTLNNTASAGASVRAALGPTFDATNIGYADGGAIQHQDAGGAAGMLYHTGGG
jgi:hypothetical protein